MRGPVRMLVALGLFVGGAGCSADDGRTATPALAVAGYVAPWDPRSRSALERPPDGVVELNPVWYQPVETGELTVVNTDPSSQLEAPASTDSDREVRLVPSVSNFRAGRWDGPLVTDLLDDPARRRTHIEALLDASLAPGVDGLDIDYESLGGDHRDAYTAFIRDLARALHDADRTVTVTVHAKTSEPGDWPGARAQDWAAIGEAADAVRVMTYDHAWAGSAPGPVAPLAWVEDVVRFAVSRIPPDKVELGLPTYGYDWPEGAEGSDLAWSDAMALADSRDAVQRWDDGSASPWLTYTADDGRRHTVWYENARSLAAKLDVARRHDLRGVFLWKLGGEDPAIWDALPDR